MGLFDSIQQGFQQITTPARDILGMARGTIGNVVGPIGGITTDISGAFTPQSHMQIPPPLDIAALQQQVTGGQQQLAGLTAQQQALAQALLAQSQGQGPNLAAEQSKLALAQAQAQQAGAVAGTKGISPALAARMASEGAAQMRAQTAGQMGITQAQQQLASQQALGNVYEQMAKQQLQNVATSGQLGIESALGPARIQAGLEAANLQGRQQTQQGLLSGIGAAIKGMAGFAEGGEVQQYAKGGSTQSISDKMLEEAGVDTYAKPEESSNQFGDLIGKLMKGTQSAGAAGFADGGKVDPAYADIARIYHGMAMGGQTMHLKDQGGHVPGKAKVKGDSVKNDIVPAMLSPGEIVIPRSVVNSQNPEQEGADFIAKELAKNKKYAKGGTVEDDFKKALKQAIAQRRVK